MCGERAMTSLDRLVRVTATEDHTEVVATAVMVIAPPEIVAAGTVQAEVVGVTVTVTTPEANTADDAVQADADGVASNECAPWVKVIA